MSIPFVITQVYHLCNTKKESVQVRKILLDKGEGMGPLRNVPDSFYLVGQPPMYPKERIYSG